jgi:hypothetical protein
LGIGTLISLVRVGGSSSGGSCCDGELAGGGAAEKGWVVGSTLAADMVVAVLTLAADGM